MTDQQHPITPPPELVQQWRNRWMCRPQDLHANLRHDFQPYLITQVAQWCWDQRGAANEAELQQARDEELEACAEWLRAAAPAWERQLRAARRPKPPSETDQALNDLKQLLDAAKLSGVFNPPDNIRRCLERLKKLEEATND